MSKHGGPLMVLLIGWMVSAQAAPLKLYVAPGGNDGWSGRRADAKGKDGPFATIARARDAIRKIKADGKLPAEGAIVELRGGVYALTEPLQFAAEDSGTTEGPIVYRAREGEDVRIIGGRVVTGWKPVTDAAALAKLDPAARGKVLQADLKALGITDFGEMKSAATWAQSDVGLEFFFMDRPMTLARWPNEGYTHIADVSHVDGKVVYDYLGSKTGQFYYEGDRPSRWAGEQDIMVHGFWSLDWADQRYKIETLDPVKREITLAKPNTHAFGFRKGGIYYAYNILSELDQPGEWYLEHDTGILYFWPPSPLNRSKAIVSVLPGLLSTEKASHVTFHRLTFEATRGNAITIKGGTGVRFEACTIRNVGSWAAKLDGCDHSGFFGCDICDTGDGGVGLGGGDRQTLTPGANYVENCHIYRYGRWNPMYKPGIALTGVGQRVTHNLFNDGPHSAILFEGNDHLVEYNEFQSVVYHANDAGAIYAYHDWTFRGLVVRYNYFHDLYGGDGKGCNAVFFDNVISGNTVYGNVFANIRSKPNSAAAVFISGGRSNTVENNIFYNCDRAVYITSCLAWPASREELTRKLNEFKYREEPWKSRYPELLTLLEDEPGLARHNVVARNVRWGSGTWISLVNNAAPGTTVADNVTDEDPLLVGPDKGDFHLQPNSPALKVGFKPIPLEKIGLYKDPLRATWPVKAPIRPVPPLP